MAYAAGKVEIEVWRVGDGCCLPIVTQNVFVFRTFDVFDGKPRWNDCEVVQKSKNDVKTCDTSNLLEKGTTNRRTDGHDT